MVLIDKVLVEKCLLACCDRALWGALRLLDCSDLTVTSKDNLTGVFHTELVKAAWCQQEEHFGCGISVGRLHGLVLHASVCF